MASPNQGSVDLAVEVFGGRVTQFDPQKLPQGASPFNQDVAFSGTSPSGTGLVSGVATRPGLPSIYPPFAGNPTVNYIRTFVDSLDQSRQLFLDGLGNVQQDFPPNTISTIGTAVPDSFCQSTTYAGREWMAFGDDQQQNSILVTYTLVVTQVGSTMFYVLNSDNPSFPLTSSFNIPLNPVPDVVDPGVEFKITSPTALLINGSPSGDFLLFFNAVGGGALGAFPSSTIEDYSLSGAQLYSGPESAPTMLAGTFTLQQFEPLTAPTGNLFAGIDIPRHWNGINFDRVSQVGPGAAPIAADFDIPFTIRSASGSATQPGAAVNITSITELGSVVTVVMASSFIVLPNESIVIASVTPSSYNGTFPATQSINANTFTYTNPVSGLAAGSGGTAQSQAAKFITTTVLPPPVLISQATYNYLIGSSAVVAGVSNAAYDGTWPIIGVGHFLSGSTEFLTIAVNLNVVGTASSANGTIAPVGSVDVGLHGVSVSFVTRSNYITAPAIPAFWTAAGSLKVLLSQIPIGPPNVIARIVMFTPVIVPPALTGPFFYFNAAQNGGSLNFMSMVIQDNTTTSAVFDFSDAVLENATSATLLFNLLELGECSGVISYSERTFWLGERNKVNAAGGGGGFNNLTFDGGFSNPGSSPNYPLGWTVDLTNGSGGGSAVDGGFLAYWGDAYTITGDGSTAVLGMISQTAFQDYLGIPVLDINTAYSIRFRAAAFVNVPTGGDLVVDVFSPSLIAVLGSATIHATTLTVTYSEFIISLFDAQATLPSDLVLRIYANNTLSAFSVLTIDCIELFPTLLPVNLAQVRCSFAEQPEAFDSETGIMIMGKDNGQAMRSMKTLLDNKLYLTKERSLYVTNDDGQNEPDLWTISTVSDTVGTPSVNGTAVGESWMVIASHEGLYIFDGSQPKKISHEIQPDWDAINWDAAARIYSVVDTTNKRIHIGVPTGSSEFCNAEYVLDFAQLADAETIASTPQAYYSIYNPTKVIAPGRSRKWTIWNLFGGQGANSAAITVRADGSYHLLRGNAAGTGKVYDQVVGQFSDDGIAIAAMYQTFFMPESEQEIALQLGAYRKLFKYMSAYAWGNGQLAFTITGPQGQRQIPLSTLTLTNPAQWDWNFNVNWVGERASIIFSQFGVGSWFELTKLCPTVQKEILTSVRGNN